MRPWHICGLPFFWIQGCSPRYMKSKRLFAFISWEVGNETDTGGCDRRNDNLEITVLGEFGLTSIDGVRNVGDL